VKPRRFRLPRLPQANLFRYDATAGQYILNWGTKSVNQAGNYDIGVYTDSAGTNLLSSVTVELKK
jgi:hypothetical protein